MECADPKEWGLDNKSEGNLRALVTVEQRRYQMQILQLAGRRWKLLWQFYGIKQEPGKI